MVWSWFASSRHSSMTTRDHTWNRCLIAKKPSIHLLVCGFSHANGHQLGRSRQHALAVFFNTTCDMTILHICHTKHKEYILKSNCWYKSHPHAPYLLQLFSETNTSFFSFCSSQNITSFQTLPTPFETLFTLLNTDIHNDILKTHPIPTTTYTNTGFCNACQHSPGSALFSSVLQSPGWSFE